MPTHKILIVDDEAANLRMLQRLFKNDFEIFSAGSGAEALQLLEKHDVSIILCDQRMPGMPGVEFLKLAARMRPQTVRMIVTAYTDVAALIEAINSGVIYKYITKPWENVGLQQEVVRAIGHYEATKKRHLLEQEYSRVVSRLEQTVAGVVNAAFRIIENHSPEKAEHCRRTSAYARHLADTLMSDPDDVQRVEWAALLHELPTLGVSNVSSTDREKSLVNLDASKFEKDLQLLTDVPDLEEVATMIRFQFEWFNGEGQFMGLEGDKIPLGSRILAVANAFDEAQHHLRSELGGVDGAQYLKSLAGTELDPQIVDAVAPGSMGKGAHAALNPVPGLSMGQLDQV